MTLYGTVTSLRFTEERKSTRVEITVTPEGATDGQPIVAVLDPFDDLPHLGQAVTIEITFSI